MPRVTEGPLRVLMVCQPTTGGAARCVHQLAKAGVADGIEVTVASPDENELPGWARDVGARWVELPMQRAPGADDLRRIAQVRALARAADVVHLHSSKAGALGRLARLTLGRTAAPVVFTPHGWSWQAGGRMVPVYRAFERVTAPLADAIIAVSDGERAAGSRHLGRGGTRVVVVENGVDTDEFRPEGPRAERSDDPLLVVVGRLAYPKAQDVAIRALARVADRRTRLRLVGDGPDRPMLQALAAELGVADRVEMIGAVPDPAPHVRAADVVLLPSLSEGLSLAMLEAMACGAAIVATEVPGSSALHDVGVLVPAGDPEALAAAADRLLADEGERQRLGKLARARVQERFPLSASTSRTVALWHQLARRDHLTSA
jgi:glycosyltransferase involved in cell wall biosynthesis